MISTREDLSSEEDGDVSDSDTNTAYQKTCSSFLPPAASTHYWEMVVAIITVSFHLVDIVTDMFLIFTYYPSFPVCSYCLLSVYILAAITHIQFDLLNHGRWRYFLADILQIRIIAEFWTYAREWKANFGRSWAQSHFYPSVYFVSFLAPMPSMIIQAYVIVFDPQNSFGALQILAMFISVTQSSIAVFHYFQYVHVGDRPYYVMCVKSVLTTFIRTILVVFLVNQLGMWALLWLIGSYAVNLLIYYASMNVTLERQRRRLAFIFRRFAPFARAAKAVPAQAVLSERSRSHRSEHECKSEPEGEPESSATSAVAFSSHEKPPKTRTGGGRTGHQAIQAKPISPSLEMVPASASASAPQSPQQQQPSALALPTDSSRHVIPPSSNSLASTPAFRGPVMDVQNPLSSRLCHALFAHMVAQTTLFVAIPFGVTHAQCDWWLGYLWSEIKLQIENALMVAVTLLVLRSIETHLLFTIISVSAVLFTFINIVATWRLHCAVDAQLRRSFRRTLPRSAADRAREGTETEAIQFSVLDEDGYPVIGDLNYSNSLIIHCFNELFNWYRCRLFASSLAAARAAAAAALPQRKMPLPPPGVSPPVSGPTAGTSGSSSTEAAPASSSCVAIEMGSLSATAAGMHTSTESVDHVAGHADSSSQVTMSSDAAPSAGDDDISVTIPKQAGAEADSESLQNPFMFLPSSSSLPFAVPANFSMPMPPTDSLYLQYLWYLQQNMRLQHGMGMGAAEVTASLVRSITMSQSAAHAACSSTEDPAGVSRTQPAVERVSTPSASVSPLASVPTHTRAASASSLNATLMSASSSPAGATRHVEPSVIVSLSAFLGEEDADDDQQPRTHSTMVSRHASAKSESRTVRRNSSMTRAEPKEQKVKEDIEEEEKEEEEEAEEEEIVPSVGEVAEEEEADVTEGPADVGVELSQLNIVPTRHHRPHDSLDVIDVTGGEEPSDENESHAKPTGTPPDTLKTETGEVEEADNEADSEELSVVAASSPFFPSPCSQAASSPAPTSSASVSLPLSTSSPAQSGVQVLNPITIHVHSVSSETSSSDVAQALAALSTPPSFSLTQLSSIASSSSVSASVQSSVTQPSLSSSSLSSSMSSSSACSLPSVLPVSSLSLLSNVYFGSSSSALFDSSSFLASLPYSTLSSNDINLLYAQPTRPHHSHSHTRHATHDPDSHSRSHRRNIQLSSKSRRRREAARALETSDDSDTGGDMGLSRARHPPRHPRSRFLQPPRAHSSRTHGVGVLSSISSATAAMAAARNSTDSLTETVSTPRTQSDEQDTSDSNQEMEHEQE